MLLYKRNTSRGRHASYRCRFGNRVHGRVVVRVVLIQEPTCGSATVAPSLEAAQHIVLAEIRLAELDTALLRALAPDMVIAQLVLADTAACVALEKLLMAYVCPVVVFTVNASVAVCRRLIEHGVSAVVIDGWHPARLAAVLDMAYARFLVWRRLQGRLAYLEQALAEQQFVERARAILMRRRTLGALPAYEALLQMARRQGRPVIDVARVIVAAEENLTRSARP